MKTFAAATFKPLSQTVLYEKQSLPIAVTPYLRRKHDLNSLRNFAAKRFKNMKFHLGRAELNSHPS